MSVSQVRLMTSIVRLLQTHTAIKYSTEWRTAFNGKRLLRHIRRVGNITEPFLMTVRTGAPFIHDLCNRHYLCNCIFSQYVVHKEFQKREEEAHFEQLVCVSKYGKEQLVIALHFIKMNVLCVMCCNITNTLQ